ncbi:MAG: diacylglycerol kinase family protein [Dermatophilaceae bacterium]
MADPTSWLPFVTVLVVVVVVVVATVTVLAGGRRSHPRTTGDPAPAADGTAHRAPPKVVAVVVNPTKFDDLDPVRATLARVAKERGWSEPRLLETTADDPGTGQARRAREEGADVVCALGGDGTVRAVAAALVDTDTPLGLLPGGTGNLLARNLDLPIDDLGEAFRVCLDGVDRRIDVGLLDVTAPGETPTGANDRVFLIMAGVGFDAQVMAAAPEDLKAQVGWVAYLVSGMGQLAGPRFAASITFDEAPPRHRRIRCLIVGNVGRLQGGVELLPDAQVDDGHLDVVLLAPKGLAGWGAVAARVITKRRKGHDRVEHARCRSMVVRLTEAQEVQLDGDPIGPALTLTVTVKPLALVVRAVAQSTP